jgi:ribose/xylose/arabinose/galactoside ABC-type transport system permease subunit
MSGEGVLQQDGTDRAGASMAGAWRSPMALTRAAVLLVLALGAALTPGFLTAPSLNALLTTISVIGCLAAGMTFITLGGNIMSFALGATAAASAIVFVSVLNAAGLVPAILAALAFGAVVTGAQGLVVGSLRANAIIISIAANVLIYGVASWLIANATAYARPGAGQEILRGRVAGIPIEFLVFIGLTLLGQVILSLTAFGRHLILVGSSYRAAEAIGLPVARVTAIAYALAGLFTAVAGILLAARYNQGNMTLAVRYDYDAIAAVLVGGTAIQGGDGSMIRTFVGVAAISVIQVVLLLNGFREEWRYTITGLIVLLVVVLYSRQRT